MAADLEWLPLAELITTLPALDQFYCFCKPRLPMRVWRALNIENPRCREVAVLTSSRLRTINAWVPLCSLYPYEDGTRLVLQKLLTGSNSANEHVSYDARGARFQDRYRGGLQSTTCDRIHQNLEKVCLKEGGVCARPLSFEVSVSTHEAYEHWGPILDTWISGGYIDHIDVLKLRVALQRIDTAIALRLPSFDSLTTPVFGHEKELSRDVLALSHVLAGILDAVRPLKAIRFLCHVSGDAYTSLLNRHGLTLRRLWFARTREYAGINAPRAIVQAELEALVDQCPLLEDLMIAINRLQGDSEEREVYETLGKLQNLTYLSLLLHCHDVSLYLDYPVLESSDEEEEQSMDSLDSDRKNSENVTSTGNPGLLCVYDSSSGSSSNPSTAGFQDGGPASPQLDCEPARDVRCFGAAHVRTAMIHAALDEFLALDIFAAIFESTSSESRGWRRIHLELRAENGIYSEELTGVMSASAKWWCVERSAGDPGPRVTRIRSKGEWYTEQRGSDTALAQAVEKIFGRRWPAKSEEPGSWMTDWSSLPLWSGDEH
ncbi:hypothetical protein LTR95_009589 [Oleoguttula sp. CCFEE 5521]